jgi:glycine oxidase
MKHVRFAIVGLGIAGATLAWRLRLRGESVAVIDDSQPNSSSRVAAGLITPFTGQRFALTPRWDEFWPAAVTFYRQIEELTQTSFFTAAPAVRLFDREQFHQLAAPRVANSPALLRQCEPPAGCGQPGDIAARMLTAARVDVPAYLNATREYFASLGDCYAAKIDAERPLQLTNEGVTLPALDLKCEHFIFCTGCYPPPPEFAWLPFEAAKGELLTVEIPDLELTQVVHRNVWLAPRGGCRYQVGATFDRDNLNFTPTPAAREELLTKLTEITPHRAEVIEHSVGIRPILRGRRPIAIQAADKKGLWMFTGLGSKGCLWAPLLAESLAAHLTAGSPLDCDLHPRGAR